MCQCGDLLQPCFCRDHRLLGLFRACGGLLEHGLRLMCDAARSDDRTRGFLFGDPRRRKLGPSLLFPLLAGACLPFARWFDFLLKGEHLTWCRRACAVTDTWYERG